MRSLAAELLILPPKLGELSVHLDNKFEKLSKMRLEEKEKLQRVLITQMVTGKNIDKFCVEKEVDLQQLLAELKDLRKECEQLKKLNSKLVDKTQDLQRIIENEASGHTFFHNYPPKPDSSTDKSASRSLRKFFDNQIETLKRDYERDRLTTVVSFA